MMKWLSGLISNPASGQVSHTKLWANVAAAKPAQNVATTLIMNVDSGNSRFHHR